MPNELVKLCELTDDDIGFSFHITSDGAIEYAFIRMGIVSEVIFAVPDMPEFFAQSDNATGTFSDIRFIRENGK